MINTPNIDGLTLPRHQLISIARRIIQAYPHSKCTQVDSFAVVDKKEDFSTSNFNKTYTDFEKGTFWSRFWTKQGANPDHLKITYPALVLEQKRMLKQDICEPETCWEWWFNFIDVPDCSDCPDECNRSIEEVDYDLQIMALTFINEMLKYCLFTVIIDGEEMSMWATQQEIDCLVEAEEIEVIQKCGKLQHKIRTGAFNAVSSQLGTGNRARTVNFKLTICDCIEITNDFDYKPSKDVKKIAQAKCSAC